jgi:hypothetical protein
MGRIGFADIAGVYGIVILFAAGLILVARVKAKNAASVWRRIASGMDRSAKRVGLYALVPGAAVAVWLFLRGLPPPTAMIAGFVCAAGLFAAALGILGMEGILLETESQARARLESGLPPPSTRTGRIVALLTGGFIVLTAGGLLIWMGSL